jgi:hypothetical protein
MLRLPLWSCCSSFLSTIYRKCRFLHLTSRFSFSFCPISDLTGIYMRLDSPVFLHSTKMSHLFFSLFSILVHVVGITISQENSIEYFVHFENCVYVPSNKMHNNSQDGKREIYKEMDRYPLCMALHHESSSWKFYGLRDDETLINRMGLMKRRHGCIGIKGEHGTVRQAEKPFQKKTLKIYFI